MGGDVKSNEMILLLERYGTEARDLVASFRRAGCDCPAVVIEDDGFLPDDVQSVYGSFQGDFAADGRYPGRPLYFNEIRVPDYWEIRGTNRSGSVYDRSHERARIFYTSESEKRLVRVVDWYDERGVVRCSEHYNRWGALHGRTIFNAKGQRVNRSWFAADGREVLTENYVTGDFILNDGSAVRVFKSKTELVVYFLERSGYVGRRIFYNSLSTPFFASMRLPETHGGDVLFWQEPVRGEIPGNMQLILDGQAPRTHRICVQRRDAYERLLQLGASGEIVKRKGYLYPFVRENSFGREALICTNSEAVLHLEALATALPEVTFHVAALTEMSQKLLDMGRYENVRLYPGVKPGMLDELFARCSWYLDINRENEIVSAVRRAFLNNMLIMGFWETLHNADYVAQGHLWSEKDHAGLSASLRAFMGDEAAFRRELERQRAWGLAEENAEGFLTDF